MNSVFKCYLECTCHNTQCTSYTVICACAHHLLHCSVLSHCFMHMISSLVLCACALHTVICASAHHLLHCSVHMCLLLVTLIHAYVLITCFMGMCSSLVTVFSAHVFITYHIVSCICSQHLSLCFIQMCSLFVKKHSLYNFHLSHCPMHMCFIQMCLLFVKYLLFLLLFITILLSSLYK